MSRMRKSQLSAPPTELTKGLHALLTRSATPASYVLNQPFEELADDEIFVVLLDRASLIMQKTKARLASIRRDHPAKQVAVRLAEIESVIAGLDKEASRQQSSESSLSPNEMATLREGGFIGKGSPPGMGNPVIEAQAEFVRLRRDAVNVEEAARLLGVNESRIRQRLTGVRPTLYGMKIEGKWHLPKFQFRGRKLVPGLDKVVAALPRDLDPVSVSRWFMAPDDDLELGDGTSVSPLDWLAMGRDPSAVVVLARDL